MEGSSKLKTKNDVLKALQNTTQYRGMTYKTIEETIGQTQGKGVASLRQELTRLSQTHVKPTMDVVDATLPLDALKEILIRSDVKTVVRTCQTNRYHKTLCGDKQFWLHKLAYDNLPLPDKDLLGGTWLDYYKSITTANQRAKQIVDVVYHFNQYNQNKRSGICMIYKNANDIPKEFGITEIKQLRKGSSEVIICFEFVSNDDPNVIQYDNRTQYWDLLIGSMRTKKFPVEKIIELLTRSILDIYERCHKLLKTPIKLPIRIEDVDGVPLLYDVLYHYRFKVKPIGKCYLGAYDMMNKNII